MPSSALGEMLLMLPSTRHSRNVVMAQYLLLLLVKINTQSRSLTVPTPSLNLGESSILKH
jgi:hypothetical protein